MSEAKQLSEDEKALVWINEKVNNELSAAMQRYPSMSSPHEGYAIILEELDELWDEVKPKPANRSIDRMRAEAIQVAAMAMRFAVDITYTPEGAVAASNERLVH